jgi:hypothetical protein
MAAGATATSAAIQGALSVFQLRKCSPTDSYKFKRSIDDWRWFFFAHESGDAIANKHKHTAPILFQDQTLPLLSIFSMEGIDHLSFL